ncbi:hypothetical protein GCM10027589_22450 [Actinocorallia lasiicapitis]
MWANAVPKSQRAAKALELILERGTVTTGDLKAAGYDHPPRAIRDLKDAGFHIESKIVTVGGRRMSRYTMVDTISEGFAQRRPISSVFRSRLFDAHGYRCAVCGGEFVGRMLQADHRVPFHIGGDPEVFAIQDFMPVCGSDNRAKSMSCETCPNWTIRDRITCETCYWHDPESYEHVATAQERRLTITAQGSDVRVIDIAWEQAEKSGISLEEYTLNRLRGTEG